LTIFVAQILSSCGTIAPKLVESHSIAWDGNQNNDGILSRNRDGSFVVDSFFVDHFNYRVGKYGKIFRVSPLPKTTKIVSVQVMEVSLEMAAFERSGK
jgi:hypothetical protein